MLNKLKDISVHLVCLYLFCYCLFIFTLYTILHKLIKDKVLDFTDAGYCVLFFYSWMLIRTVLKSACADVFLSDINSIQTQLQIREVPSYYLSDFCARDCVMGVCTLEAPRRGASNEPLRRFLFLFIYLFIYFFFFFFYFFFFSCGNGRILILFG